MARARAKKEFRFTPASIANELGDRIEQGYSNDQIVAMHPDVGPQLRRWLNNERRRIEKFWDDVYARSGGSYYD